LFSIPVENPEINYYPKIDDFKTEYNQNYEKYFFNKVYNGYYDNPNYFDIKDVESLNTNQNVEMFFNKER
jgi:hypothetical protein